MGTRIGIDVGGTFTDFVLVSEGRIAVEKYPTTPGDPSVGALEGLDLLLQRHTIAPESIQQIVHGTTLVANALIERKGAVVGLLATQGFRDTLEIRREVRSTSTTWTSSTRPRLRPAICAERSPSAPITTARSSWSWTRRPCGIRRESC